MKQTKENKPTNYQYLLCIYAYITEYYNYRTANYLIIYLINMNIYSKGLCLYL